MTRQQTNNQKFDGRFAAMELIDQMATGPRPLLLGYTVKIMIEKGEFGSFEIGFFQALAERVLR